MIKTGFIGAGTTGTALAVRLSQRGCPVVAVSSRKLSSAQKLAALVPDCRVCYTAQDVAEAAELVFITTPDDVVAQVCSEVRWSDANSVVHCSGAHSVNILESAKKLGAAVGSFHPLQTFADVNQAMQNLPGSTFALEAEEPLLTIEKELTQLLDGNCVELKPGDKVLYHAAAVFACNYMVTLFKQALDLWLNFGVSSREATKALMPLLQGTINNIKNIGLPDCLTGPVARGDLNTIESHLSALETRSPDLLTTYRELGLKTIPIALSKGKVSEQKAKEMMMIFQDYEFTHCRSEGAERPKNLTGEKPRKWLRNCGDSSLRST